MEHIEYSCNITKNELCKRLLLPTWESSNFAAWEHCYNAFEKARQTGRYKEDVHILCLHLAAYLASWGMYRGSGFIYKYNYTMYEKVVDIVMCKEYENLNRLKLSEMKNKAELIYKLYHLIQSMDWGQTNNRKNTPSDTLITKIMLGTLACTPAFDENVKIALKELNLSQSFNAKTLKKLSQSIALFNNTILWKEFERTSEPEVKILDTCLFAVGASINKKKKGLQHNEK